MRPVAAISSVTDSHAGSEVGEIEITSNDEFELATD
jgi:hypothetical protein